MQMGSLSRCISVVDISAPRGRSGTRQVRSPSSFRRAVSGRGGWRFHLANGICNSADIMININIDPNDSTAVIPRALAAATALVPAASSMCLRFGFFGVLFDSAIRAAPLLGNHKRRFYKSRASRVPHPLLPHLRHTGSQSL